MKAQFSDSLTLIGVLVSHTFWDKGKDGANKGKPKVIGGLLHCAKTT